MLSNVCELYRIGPGPSSSRTIGPLLAAHRFVRELAADELLPRVGSVRVELFGGLACTGREQTTDRAVIGGLAGLSSDDCDAGALARCAYEVERTGQMVLGGHHTIAFAAERDIAFCVNHVVAYDGNAARFVARDRSGNALASSLYFSVGDGDVRAENEVAAKPPLVRVPFPFATIVELLERGHAHRKKIAELALANAGVHRSPGEIRSLLLDTARAMRASIDRGLAAETPLPGGRARMARALFVAAGTAAPAQRCAAYAVAVSEENAAGGRVVAAPSNGAAGPVAAMLRFSEESLPLAGDSATIVFLMTAATVGALLRAGGLRQAGCQSEVGLAAAMAAAGYAAVHGGTNEHVLHAAELALEPHLGFSCDPDGALIQQPCIERNAKAAAIAQAAAGSALRHPSPRIALDALVNSMVERGRGMAGRFKEASLGGVAVNVVDC